ncbi:hypothetical protein H0H81_005784 [Sphagnurus paluster]|uniref:ABM domain-containing protein n=1 Tax=Sphagnurus paluster TaxID=117069 RepID=A0A9P7FU28_9AGAR|nr:hypothetical protein H0H81_005784 [Sphagnurus paluster]
MSRPAVEFARFKSSGALASQPSLLQELLAGAQEGGLKAQSYGATIEKPDEFVWLMYRANYKWPEARGEFFPKLMAVCDGNPSMPWVIEVDSLPDSAGHLTFKPAVPIEEIKSIMEYNFQLQGSAPGIRGGVWGFHTDDDHRVSVITGWDSLEAHHGLRKLDVFKELGQKIRELLEDKEIYHVELKHFP